MDSDVVRIAQIFGIVGVFLVAMIGAVLIAVVTARSKRNSSRPPQALGVDDARFERLERAVDTIAVEVERVTEGQRFMAKLLSERQPAQLPEKQREG